ncbi:MAG: glycosyltransferase [Candidatus Aureabacteria bacterium]|nr:glycosyltransferase [Candidatus Auribacterota bacterium]
MHCTILICTPDSSSRTFKRCLKSVIDNTDDYELLIFDNNNALDFNHAKEINKAIRKTKTRYFVTLDDDVIVKRDWLKQLLDTSKRAKAGIVGCIHKYPDGTINHSGGYVLLDGRSAHYTQKIKKNAAFPYVCSAVMLIDLDATKKKKLCFDEKFTKYYQDADFCLMCWKKGIRVVSSYSCEVIHLIGKAANKRKDINEIDLKDTQLFQKKWINGKNLEKLLKKISRRVVFGGFGSALLCTDILKKYNIASKSNSISLFKKVLEKSSKLLKKGVGKELAGGACFHIAEILIKENKKKAAIKYLTKCLKYIPEHKKAAKLLKRIGSSN